MRKRYTRQQSEDRFNTFLSVFFVTVLFGGLLYAMVVINPIEQQEKIACNKLQKQAEYYKNFMYSPTNIGGFYITKADKEMCDMYNIKIDSVVR